MNQAQPSQAQEAKLPEPTLAPKTNVSLYFGGPLLTPSQLAILYPPQLDTWERFWRNRYNFLRDTKGLVLRPRYHPDWTPSWLSGQGKHPAYCEDAIRQILPIILDARNARGEWVCMKLTQRQPGKDEVGIARYLASFKDQENHTVDILDSFQDPVHISVDFIVMPVLRPFDEPKFGAVGEVVDFVSQMLEGLQFMHDRGVAHCDLTGPNIMMDGRPICPQGWHFVADWTSSDGAHALSPLARIDHPVRYYIVDYGHSVQPAPGELIAGMGGRDSDPPELAARKPCDPYKLDVFTTANVFLKDLHRKYLGLDFLVPLIEFMMTPDFQQRPTARASLDYWGDMKGRLNIGMARWRLQKPDETVGARVVLNTITAARQGIHSLKYLFDSEPRTWTDS